MEQGEHSSLTRRDVVKGAAKIGAAGAAIAWVAPSFDSVAYAADGTGSPEPTTSTGPTTTTEGEPGDRPTCAVDPKVLRFPVPFRIRVLGTKWAPSSKVTISLVGVKVLGVITTRPDGSFDTRVEVPGSATPGVYQIEMTGYDAKGNRFQCFERFEIAGSSGTQGSTTTRDGSSETTSGGGDVDSNGGGNASGNGSGDLPLTGSDSRNLLLIGAGAVIAGRTLYGLRSRIANMAADGDIHSR